MIYLKKFFEKRKGDKKGSMDIAFWIVVAFVLIVGFIVIKFVWTEIFSELQTSEIYEDEAKINLDSVNNNFIPLMDAFFVIVILGVMIATIIGAYALRTHPAFWIIAIFLTIIELIIAVPLANAYNDQISTDGNLAETADSFTISNYIFAYLPMFVFVFNALVSIIMYGLGRNEYG